jgi:hypothetical protein
VKTYFENQKILCPFIIDQNILLAIMSPRSNGFQAISFDGGISYEANEPLIVGNAEEEEEHRLEEKAIPRFKLSALLFGLLAGFGMVLVITLSGEDLAIKN